MMTLFVLISSTINQWKIACVRKKYTRLIDTLQAELQKIINKIQVAELRRIKLLQEVRELSGLSICPLRCISVIFLQYLICPKGIFLSVDCIFSMNCVTFLRNLPICCLLNIGI